MGPHLVDAVPAEQYGRRPGVLQAGATVELGRAVHVGGATAVAHAHAALLRAKKRARDAQRRIAFERALDRLERGWAQPETGVELGCDVPFAGETLEAPNERSDRRAALESVSANPARPAAYKRCPTMRVGQVRPDLRGPVAGSVIHQEQLIRRTRLARDRLEQDREMILLVQKWHDHAARHGLTNGPRPENFRPPRNSRPLRLVCRECRSRRLRPLG